MSGLIEGRDSGFVPVRAALRDGRTVTIRAISPHDSDALQAAFSRLSSESRYARFMSPLRELGPALLRRAVQPAEGDRTLVVVAGEGAGEIIVGGSRYLRTTSGTDGGICEFAVTIADDWQGAGLASRLMRELIRDAGAHGLKRMDGFVLASNRPMLDLARRLGFEVGASDEGPSVNLVRLALAAHAARG